MLWDDIVFGEERIKLLFGCAREEARGEEIAETPPTLGCGLDIGSV